MYRILDQLLLLLLTNNKHYVLSTLIATEGKLEASHLCILYAAASL